METKAVFDTNIWISYFLGGKITELTEMVLFHEVSLYRAKELTNELKIVLSRKKFFQIPDFANGKIFVNV